MRKAAARDSKYGLFILLMKAEGFTPDQEYKFHETRKWRFDFAFPNHKLAIEVEGAIWTNGRHTRGSGFVKDMEKYNNATQLGWRILRFTPSNLFNKESIDMIVKCLS